MGKEKVKVGKGGQRMGGALNSISCISISEPWQLCLYTRVHIFVFLIWYFRI